jgi:POT family proton-dependent oligopeptide transporter
MNDTTFPAPVLTSKHPHSFYRLCLAVLCERWAAFMLISTAALMLCERYGLPPAVSLRWLGIASAAYYVGSLPGGYLLGSNHQRSRRGIGIGSLFLLLGYITLSLPYQAALYVAFALLFVGHSLYKPSTQRILASLYATGDSKLEGAQVLLHMMVNIGAVGGSLLAGCSQYAGWNVTYGCAALMMSLAGVATWPSQHQRDSPNITVADALRHRLNPPLPSTPNSTQIIVGLTLAMFLFTLCTAQAEGALLLWSRDRIDRVILGFEIPIAWFLAFPAVLVLLLAPIQLALLPRLKRSIGTSRLVALGLVAAALCFAVLLPTTLWTHRVSMAWLAASLSFFVLAELLIAPLGLALLIRSTPPRFVGVITGLWYGAGALGYFVGGEIGTLWSRWPTHAARAASADRASLDRRGRRPGHETHECQKMSFSLSAP